MWGWNVELLDSDNHKIVVNNKVCVNKTPIIIGSHIWIAFYASLLKGTIIKDGCIVVYRSLVKGLFPSEKLLIGGHLAKVIKENIKWSRDLINFADNNDDEQG